MTNQTPKLDQVLAIWKKREMDPVDLKLNEIRRSDSLEQIRRQENEELVEAGINTVSCESMWTLSCAPSDGFHHWIAEPLGDSHVED